MVKSTLKVILVTLGLFVSAARAQDTAPPMTAPPPPKVISPEERSKIDENKDEKGRIRTTLELAESRLNKAQSLTEEHDFHGASTELGRYAALIEDALAFL